MDFTSRLPLITHPHADESLLGFAGRVMETNGYSSQHGLWQFTGLTKSHVDEAVIEKLAFVSGAPVETIKALPNRAVVDGMVEACGHRVAADKISISPALCLHCFSEAPYHRAIWDLRWFRACPKHECLLTAICPTCDEPLLWQRKRLEECPNGHPLIGMEHKARRAKWKYRAEVIIEEIVTSGEARSVRLPDPLRQLSLDALIDVLIVLGGFGKREYAALCEFTAATEPSRASLRMNRGLEHALGWPTSLQKYVRAQGARPGGGRGPIRNLRAGIRRLEGTLAGKIFGDDWKCNFPENDQIDIEVSDPALELQGDMTLADAAVEIDCSKAEIARIAEVDGLVRRHKHGYYNRTILLREVFEEWVAQGRVWWKLERIALRWKIDVTELIEACKKGLIGFQLPVDSGIKLSDRFRIRWHEIEALEALMMAPRKRAEEFGKPLSELDKSFSSMIRSIRAGTWVTCGWAPEQGFGDAKFAMPGRSAGDVLEPPRSNSPSQPAPKISLTQIAKRMYVALSAVERMRRDGFLGKTESRGALIDADPADVAIFEATYVSPQLLHKELAGPSLAEIYRTISRLKIQPVGKAAKSFMGGMHQSQFYRRSDLQGIDFT